MSVCVCVIVCLCLRLLSLCCRSHTFWIINEYKKISSSIWLNYWTFFFTKKKEKKSQIQNKWIHLSVVDVGAVIVRCAIYSTVILYTLDSRSTINSILSTNNNNIINIRMAHTHTHIHVGNPIGLGSAPQKSVVDCGSHRRIHCIDLLRQTHTVLHMSYVFDLCKIEHTHTFRVCDRSSKGLNLRKRSPMCLRLCV